MSDVPSPELDKTGTARDAGERTLRAPMLRVTEWFKRAMAGVLLVLMMIIVLASVFELAVAMLAWVVPTEFINAANALIDVEKILSVLGVFLTVLIALELIETVEVYFRSSSIHVEIVVAVAIIAIARKFILLDPHEYSGAVIAALGFVALSLGAVYWLVRRTGRPE